MSILKIKDSQGNWVGVPTVKGDTGNGISSTTLNDDYTLTLSFTDGTTYTTPSIRGEKGEQGEPATGMEIHICSLSEYDAETRIPTIANPNDKTFYLVPTEDGTSPDLFTEWVYVNNAWEMFGSASVDLSGYLTDVKINGNSVVTDGVANIPKANSSTYGVVKVNGDYGIGKMGDGSLTLILASERESKDGTNMHNIIAPINQHISTFYGLAKASGDTTQSQSDNPVGTYTDEAKASIKNMLGVEDVDIDSKAPVITETISGDIVSFPDGADDIPLKSCIVQVEPVQEGSGDPSPDNVRPISGFTGVEVQRTGKNLLNADSVYAGYKQDDGSFVIRGSVAPSIKTYIPASLVGTELTFSAYIQIPSGSTIINPCVAVVVGGTARKGTYVNTNTYTRSTITFTPTSTDDCVLITYGTGGVQNMQFKDIQLEIGNTTTDYEPYQGQTISINWQSEAGTIYGGYVDVLNGELVVDRVYEVLNNPDKWNEVSGTANFRYNVSFDGRKIYDNSYSGVTCSYVPCLYGAEPYGRWNSASGTDFCIKSSTLTLEQVKADAEAGKISIAYELETPITYQLTPQEITSLLGQNNIWSNAGNVSVEYRADTELYIDKQIPDVPVEDVQINGTSIVQDGVASIPLANSNDFGVVKLNGNYGIQQNSSKLAVINRGNDSEIKLGANAYKPIVPYSQHMSTFYGLAKAAGDTTQSQSSNAVGTYTDEAKTAIKQMLDVKDDYDSLVVEVSGTDPVITGKASYRYNCGELYTLSITPPSSGTMDIIFTSGATPTVLTLPETVKMPDWWAGIETNTTYEMCITDGTYCGVMSWAT